MINRVHPDIKDSLNVLEPLDYNYYEEIREYIKNAPADPIDDDMTIENKFIDRKDEPPVRVRIYRENGRNETLPVLIWIHGGGFVISTPEGDDGVCQRIAKGAKCVVVSVDYRLSPEHPYPAALNDCYATLTWIAENSSELNIDKSRIGVAGESAGGNLTAALALLTKDRNGPELILQMPLYPMLDDLNNNFSNKEITGNFVWNYSLNEQAWKMYLGELKESDDIPYYAAPARATVEQLKNLPYTYTFVGQLDPFRDETTQFITKLAEAGVDVDYRIYAGAYHAFEVLGSDTEYGKKAIKDYIDAAKYGLHRNLSVEMK